MNGVYDQQMIELRSLFEQKTAAVFQHVYDGYYGAGRSVYALAA